MLYVNSTLLIHDINELHPRKVAPRVFVALFTVDKPGPFDLRVEITQNRANSTRDALYGLSAR